MATDELCMPFDVKLSGRRIDDAIGGNTGLEPRLALLYTEAVVRRGLQSKNAAAARRFPPPEAGDDGTSPKRRPLLAHTFRRSSWRAALTPTNQKSSRRTVPLWSLILQSYLVGSESSKDLRVANTKRKAILDQKNENVVEKQTYLRPGCLTVES